MMLSFAMVFALLLGSLIFIVLPRCSPWQRLASAFVFVASLAVVYGGAIEMLSRPKPLGLEWRHAAKAKVLGASLDEGKAIYVWLQIGKSVEPRAYKLPWNTSMAQQLQTAMREGAEQGTGVEVANPFGTDADGSKRRGNGNGVANSYGHSASTRFYARPQPPMPAKTHNSDAAFLH
jgi:hypothetical protein